MADNPNSIRLQIQWNDTASRNFSVPLVALDGEVRCGDAIAALHSLLATVVPGQAKTAAEPAVLKMVARIASLPPTGVGPQCGNVLREYFRFRYAVARVDLENTFGQNLRES